MDEFLEKYRQLVSDIDSEIARIAGLHPNLKCCPGCADCCRPFSVFPIEAEVIRLARRASAAASRGGVEKNNGFCVMLDNKRCSIYEHRPLICRTQGLPIGYINHDQGAIEVSACELNFSGQEEFDIDHLLLMDGFNASLQEINLAFSIHKKIDPLDRIPISELV